MAPKFEFDYLSLPETNCHFPAQNRTIKENVLFGSDLDDKWYRDTVESWEAIQ